MEPLAAKIFIGITVIIVIVVLFLTIPKLYYKLKVFVNEYLGSETSLIIGGVVISHVALVIGVFVCLFMAISYIRASFP